MRDTYFFLFGVFATTAGFFMVQFILTKYIQWEDKQEKILKVLQQSNETLAEIRDDLLGVEKMTVSGDELLDIMLGAAKDYVATYALWKEVMDTQGGDLSRALEQKVREKHAYLISLCKEYMREEGDSDVPL